NSSPQRLMSMTRDLSRVCQRPAIAFASSARADDMLHASDDRTMLPQTTKVLTRVRSADLLPILDRMRQTSGDARLRRRVKPLPRLCLIVGAIAFAWATGTTALAEASGALDLPYQLVLLDQRLPGIFRIHMAASGLGLILLPWALLSRRQGMAHRIPGRACASSLIIGVAAALPSAVMGRGPPVPVLGCSTPGGVSLVCCAHGLPGAGVA